MRRSHRITLHKDDLVWADLERAGARIDRKGAIIWVCTLWEDEPAWQEIEPMLARRENSYSSGLVYSGQEIATAEYLEILALGHHGYPQP